SCPPYGATDSQRRSAVSAKPNPDIGPIPSGFGFALTPTYAQPARSGPPHPDWQRTDAKHGRSVSRFHGNVAKHDGRGARKPSATFRPMNDLAGKHIVLGLTGGIACYKAAELCRALVKEGATVQVVMTEASEQFITPVTMQALSGRPVFTSQWDARTSAGIDHNRSEEHTSE